MFENLKNWYLKIFSKVWEVKSLDTCKLFWGTLFFPVGLLRPRKTAYGNPFYYFMGLLYVFILIPLAFSPAFVVFYTIFAASQFILGYLSRIKEVKKEDDILPKLSYKASAILFWLRNRKSLRIVFLPIKLLFKGIAWMLIMITRAAEKHLYRAIIEKLYFSFKGKLRSIDIGLNRKNNEKPATIKLTAVKEGSPKKESLFIQTLKSIKEKTCKEIPMP